MVTPQKSATVFLRSGLSLQYDSRFMDTNCIPMKNQIQHVTVTCLDTMCIVPHMDWTELVKNAAASKDPKITHEVMAEWLNTTRGNVSHYLSKKREPSLDQILILFKKLGIKTSELDQDSISISNAHVGPEYPHPFRRVPVVGRAQGGDNGYMEEEQYPIGHGNGWLEFPTKDLSAFGLLVQGDSMQPRFRHGEYALVEPNAVYEIGEDVYVSLHDGRKLIKLLGWDRHDSIQLLSLNHDHKPITILKSNIACIYPVTPVHRRHFVHL